MVNVKTEMEIRNLHQKMDMLIAEQTQDLFKMQQTQLGKLEKIEKKLDV